MPIPYIVTAVNISNFIVHKPDRKIKGQYSTYRRLSGKKTCLLSQSKCTINASNLVQFTTLVYLTLTVITATKQDFRYAKYTWLKALKYNQENTSDKAVEYPKCTTVSYHLTQFLVMASLFFNNNV